MPLRGISPAAEVYFASLAEFQGNAGTGTATNPANLNNNDTATAAVFDAVGEYVEVDFGKDVLISAYRHYGYANHVGDGRYMLQYWDGSAWVNLVFGILTRAASWSDFAAFKTVKTTKVRVVATALDTYDNSNHAHEWEIIGDGTPNLTVADFQANAATGTAASPEDLNDTLTVAPLNYSVIGQYAEVKFNKMFKVKEFKQFGNTNNVGDGLWKIQYWDGDSWVDSNTDIPTVGDGWGSWTALTTPFATSKVRWVATTIDSQGISRVNEVEMRD